MAVPRRLSKGQIFQSSVFLVDYAGIEKRANRSANKKMSFSGVHQPARHLHNMTTIYSPFRKPFENFCKQTTSASLVFLGVGLYFLILLLVCYDVESNPGPFNFTAIENYQFNRIFHHQIKAEDLFPVIDELINKMNDLETEKIEKSKLASRVPELEKRIACLEREQRRKNIVVFGVPTEDDLNKAVDDVILKKLKLEKHPSQEMIERAYRIGRKAPQRPILIRFNTVRDKERAMSLAPQFKGTRISISDDLTMEERQSRFKIVDAQKAARAKNVESKVLPHGLLVNGEILSPAELDRSDWLQRFLRH